MTTLDRRQGTATAPRWQRIADAIEADITSGVFAAGDSLPTVMTLAQRFGVNRHTIRQALLSLQSRGLVSVEQGRGTFVRLPRYDYRLGRRVRFRNALSGDRTDLVTRLVGISRCEPAPEQIEALRLAPADRLWRFVLCRIVDDLPLSTSTHFMSVDRFPDLDRALDADDMRLTTVFKTYGIDDYVRISTRILAARPSEEEQRLLRIGSAQPVLITRGIDGLPDGTPFHETNTCFAGDRIELVLEPGTLG